MRNHKTVFVFTGGGPKDGTSEPPRAGFRTPVIIGERDEDGNMHQYERHEVKEIGTNEIHYVFKYRGIVNE